MTALLSIFISAFDAERWIRRTIESPLVQSWQNKTVIIVDDESTNGTLVEARRFPSPSVVTKENRGASAAGNHAYQPLARSHADELDAHTLHEWGRGCTRRVARQSPARRGGGPVGREADLE